MRVIVSENASNWDDGGLNYRSLLVYFLRRRFELRDRSILRMMYH